MTTVMDQARPWLMPSRALAATIQPQLGATAISSGTGSATAQPAISRRRRPARCGERAGAEVGERLGDAEGDDERQDRGARGQAEVLAADERQRRAFQADHRADERVDRDQQRELRAVLAQPQPDLRCGHATSASGRPLRLAATIAACCSGAGGMSLVSACTNASSESNCSAAVVAALEADRRDRVGRQARARRPTRSSAPDRARGGRAASAAARSASGRACAPSPRRCARRARAGPGRPASPTSSASPVSTNHGSSPRVRSVTR